MKSRSLNFFSELRASYWYIPLLLSIGSFLLSILTLRLDHLFVWKWLQTVGWYHASNPEGARAVLSIIATSMITVAGVTFSMTIVAVAFAANQAGPRLTSNFMRDKGNQVTLGTFVATFLYCLFILLALFNANKIGMNQSESLFIPQISLLVAIILALTSISVLIYFFHHIPESINMSNVIARIGEEIYQQLDNPFLSRAGNECLHIQTFPFDVYSVQTSINAKNQGYIRFLDAESLIKIAKKYDLIFKLDLRCGDFVSNHDELLTIYSKEKINNIIHTKCINSIVLGHKRNPDNDTFFLVDEMVEIIARALSPGVNDPFTAINCFDWIKSNIKKMSDIKKPSCYRYDEDNNIRLIARSITFSEWCDLIFCRVQPYVCNDMNASIYMMTMIISLSKTITKSEDIMVLEKHAVSLKVAAKACLLPQDFNHLLKAYEQLPTK